MFSYWVAVPTLSQLVQRMMAQGLAAGIYATNNAEACQYVSAHSKAEFILCEGQKQLDKFIEVLTNKVDGGIHPSTANPRAFEFPPNWPRY